MAADGGLRGAKLPRRPREAAAPHSGLEGDQAAHGRNSIRPPLIHRSAGAPLSHVLERGLITADPLRIAGRATTQEPAVAGVAAAFAPDDMLTITSGRLAELVQTRSSARADRRPKRRVAGMKPPRPKKHALRPIVVPRFPNLPGRHCGVPIASLVRLISRSSPPSCVFRRRYDIAAVAAPASPHAILLRGTGTKVPFSPPSRRAKTFR